MTSYFWRWAFVVTVAVQLALLYAPSAPSVPTGGVRIDWLVHLAVFAAVTWVGRRAGLPYVPLLVVVAVHAPVSELVQHWWLPHRTGDPTDVLADLAGVALGALLPARATAGRSAPYQGP